jgi:type II secretory pathway pseudopilin PulG
MKRKGSTYSSESGFTLMEMMVSLGVSFVVFAGLVQQYTSSAALSYDSSIRINTLLEAQALMQGMGLELRMVGNGVPFDQANFQIGEDTLTDPTVTRPIDVTTATATNLTFRINETGDVYLLTQDFDPTASLVINLTSVSGLNVDDPIYISNSVVSGEDGFYGMVKAVDAGNNSVTVYDLGEQDLDGDDASYVMSPAATFDMGSILEEVPEVTYTQDGTSITRNSGFGAVTMALNSTVTFTYLDQNMTEVVLPLTDDKVINQLRAVRVRIEHTSSKNLKNGQEYTAVVEQVFGIRNLNYAF